LKSIHKHTFTATDITDQLIMYSIAMYQLHWLSHVHVTNTTVDT